MLYRNSSPQGFNPIEHTVYTRCQTKAGSDRELIKEQTSGRSDRERRTLYTPTEGAEVRQKDRNTKGFWHCALNDIPFISS